eukprot:TRINITY_DN5826_c0_g1_i1.p2 TRINITY_DN5826_c0_g1~~TRINITY_DN5826_c0_g1_i1.p2  ORF type:complete len:161 (+),score=74.77 TRINITY_DN5826_c0_g1_i1:65-484(+)
MADQDWTPVVLKKHATRGAPKTNAELNAAFAKGEVESVRKVSHKGVPANAHKLENETEDFHHQHVTHEFKVALMKARQAKGWNQSELAQRLNVRATVINEYESGKAIPNPQLISQMNRLLGTSLPKIPKKKASAESMAD